ncbi:MAG: transcriptional regulator, TetR family [Acidimicrobiales bacterium]|nr:transcriptional regulator, TetR family [Acidimicrobiales bacterium]
MSEVSTADHPRDQPAGGRHDRIVRAAIDVVAERGYVGASLREVAAAAGIEKGHLTYYFRTKDDLLFEIVDDLHQRFLDGLAGWLAGPEGTAPAQLRQVLVAHVELVCELTRQTRVAYESMRFLTSERYRTVAAKRFAYERRIGALIERSRDELGVADDATNILTKVVLGVVNWPYQWYDPAGRDSPAKIAQVIADRAMASLRA